MSKSEHVSLFGRIASGFLLLAIVFGLFQSFWANDAVKQVGYAQAGQYDLRIDKELTSGGLVFSGDTVSYQLEIYNADEGASYSAANVEVVDAFPEGVTLDVLTVSASIPPFFYTVNYDAGAREMTLVFDSLDFEETVTITYDATVSTTGIKQNIASIQPEIGAPAESVPYGTGSCAPGNDPIANEFAVAGTNNIDCEQFTVQIATASPECGADHVTNNSGDVFYGTTEPTALCNVGSSSVPQSTLEVGKWTWTCISGGSTVACEAVNPHCGDSTINTGIAGEIDETCDDGNTVDGDGCSALCQIEGCTDIDAYNYSATAIADDGSCLLCGDGLLQNALETGGVAEECDDLNTTANDGCSATCVLENVRMSEVIPSSDRVTIRNYGNETVDLSSYRLYSQFASTSAGGLQTLNLLSGSLSLAPGATVTVDGFAFDDIEADLSLYKPLGSFSSASVMSDFVQRGGGGNGRESVAVAKGIWTAGEFLDENAPFTYPGDGSTFGASVWVDIPSVCGNGVVQVGEVCDDGNTASGDGCANDCTAIESGWTCPMGGGACSDVNECVLLTDNCHANALCVNNDGGFSCDCSNGFAGDGVSTCDDIDECALGTDTCSDDATCSNTVGGFNCACNFGYTGDGITCTDIDECATGANNCDANATCSNDPGSFSCTCNSGYAGPGNTCAEVCGDSIVTPGEQCDDGNTLNGDGCDASCDRETPDCSLGLSPTTGSLALTVDGTVSGISNWELITGRTWGEGGTSPAGATTAQHTYFLSGMHTVTVNLVHRDNGSITASCENYVEAETNCGDGLLEFGEQCDAAGSNGVVCSAGYGGTCTYCSNSCQIEIVTGSFCGDSTTDIGNGEQCDFGAGNNNGTCNGPYEGSCTACTATCNEVTFFGGVCGDGVIDVGYEQCDDANAIDDDDCNNVCIRNRESGGASSLNSTTIVLRQPRTDRTPYGQQMHGTAPGRYGHANPALPLPKNYKNLPMYTPGAYQYSYTDPTRTFETIAFKQSLQALLKAIPQMQRNNVIGIDENAPADPVEVKEFVEIPVMKIEPVEVTDPEPVVEITEQPEEKEWEVTKTPREELIEMLKKMQQ